MRCKTVFSIGLAIFLGLVSTLVQAERMHIVIEGGKTGGLPIAVVPFQVQGDKTAIPDMAQIIHADLFSSGQFAPLSFQSLQQFPKQASEVQFPYWQGLNVQDLICGQIRQTGNSRYSVRFELLDVMKQKAGQGQAPLLSMQFDNIAANEVRALAHHISDLIFEKLIGVKGFFSTRIAYVSVVQTPTGPVHALELADYDGYNPRILFRSRYPIMSPAWSPEGKRIAFVSFEKERSSINVVEVQTGQTQRLTQFPGLNSAPAWSPDGKTLALVLSKEGTPKIYTLDLASKKLNKVTEGAGIDTEPSFAPDGRSLVFTSDRGGKPQIYRVTLATGKTERVTFAGNFNAKPSLTPDGKNLVTLHRPEGGGLFCVAVHSLEYGGVRLLTQTGLNDSPTLAPNGMMVIYGAQSAGRRVLGAVSLDGRFRIRLPNREAEVQEPAWSPFTH